VWGTEHVPAAALGPGGGRTAPGGSGRFGEPAATERGSPARVTRQMSYAEATALRQPEGARGARR